MGEQIPTAQRALFVQRVQIGQRRGLFVEDLFGQHMALYLHLAEYNFQRADEIRDAMGQCQINQLDTRWHGQTGIANHDHVTVAKRSDQSRQRDVKQRSLFHAGLNACTSDMVGIDGCAPARVTDSAAAICP